MASALAFTRGEAGAGSAMAAKMGCTACGGFIFMGARKASSRAGS